MQHRKYTNFIIVILAIVMLLQVLSVSAFAKVTGYRKTSDEEEEPDPPVWTPPPVPETKRVSNTGFPDVEIGAWYEEYILLLNQYDPGIISGYQDGTFRPELYVKRGEFLKMAMTAVKGSTSDHTNDAIHWAAVYYTMALENNVLIPDPYGGNQPMFACTSKALNAEINRYEMAVIINNICTYMLREPSVQTTKAPGRIRDYKTISEYTTAEANSKPGQFTMAVEQAYGKGILLGYEDKSFQGTNSLKRCEAATVITRLVLQNKRTMPEWATKLTENASSLHISGNRPNGFKSFAEWLHNGHIDENGKLDIDARTKLFGWGTPAFYRGYFESAEEAEPFMQAVVVPIWEIDENGNKQATTAWLSVHREVAEEVRLIFQQIFDSSERFPIYSRNIGGARFSDSGRHAWGCAIDINPYTNCECNFISGGQTLTCGYGWWPSGLYTPTWCGRDTESYHGILAAPSEYSISPYSSVVKAFSDYGWGWGGSGSNVVGAGNGWNFGKNYDFMHFSVLPSGG